MVPLGALMTVEPTFGPTRVTRYNGYPSADLNGAANPGFSSGQAEAEIEALLKKTLPRGMGYEWTELTYQDRLTRDVTLARHEDQGAGARRGDDDRGAARDPRAGGAVRELDACRWRSS